MVQSYEVIEFLNDLGNEMPDILVLCSSLDDLRNYKGDGDIDVLFRQKDRDTLITFLNRGYFFSVERALIGEEQIHVFIFDVQLRKLGHVHLQFRLFDGDVLDRFHLGLLNRGVTLADTKFKVLSYSDELYLRLVKARNNQSYWERKVGRIRELTNLVEVVEFQNLYMKDGATEVVFPEYYSDIEVFIKGTRYSLRRKFRFDLVKHVKSLLRRFKVLRVFFRKRVLKKSGTCVVLLGCDGSGKSTQVASLKEYFDGKIDYSILYLGSGNGSKSMFRVLGERLFRRNAGNSRRVSQKSGRVSGVKKVVLTVYAISIAVEKVIKLKYMELIRQRGQIVICDRYPQIDTLGINDGPLLQRKEFQFGLWAHIKHFELRLYKIALNSHPDLAIKLIASPEALLKRKPNELNIELISRKQKAVQNISFNKSTNVQVINTEASIKDVTESILMSINKSLIDAT